MQQLTIPGGDRKGVPLQQAEAKDIEYWVKRISADLDKNPQKKFADRDRRWLEGARAELERRAQGGKQEPKPQTAPGGQPNKAITRTSEVSQIVVGTFNNAAAATKALLDAEKQYHLISPATVVGRLPEGCEIWISLVHIDPYGREVYTIAGDRDNPKEEDTVGIDKVGILRIGGSAGVSWEYSRRTDDGTHPHFCSWEAVALFRLFDLRVQRIPGNVSIDTREDGEVRGAAAEEIRRKAAARKKQYPDKWNDGGDGQLLELRKFLDRHAESKAMLKAIGNKGVYRSYKRKDLHKPFAVASLMFTGYSEDPDARREFRQMIGQAFLGSAAALYGPSERVLSAPQVIHQVQLPQGPAFVAQPPPPIGSVHDEDDYDTSGEEQPGSNPQNEQPAQQPSTAASDQVAKQQSLINDEPKKY